MSNKEWFAALSPEERHKLSKKGGKARAKTLSKARRIEIARLGGIRKSLIHKAKTQPIK